MKYANLAIDYENETKKNFALTKRLQDYAQKIASQEVKYLQALAMALPSNAVGNALSTYQATSDRDDRQTRKATYTPPWDAIMALRLRWRISTRLYKRKKRRSIH